MAEKQILINCGKKWFEFSKSRTGQLDYCGKVENPSRLTVENYQKHASSAYFSPGYYVFLQDGLNCTPRIYVSPETDVSDKDTFDFLLHVGALLCAVEARDSLLAGELFTVSTLMPLLEQYKNTPLERLRLKNGKIS